MVIGTSTTSYLSHWMCALQTAEVAYTPQNRNHDCHYKDLRVHVHCTLNPWCKKPLPLKALNPAYLQISRDTPHIARIRLDPENLM